MRRSLLCSTTCAAVGLLLAAGGAAAQTTGAAAADPASELDEITVTGTRVQRDGYDAPTPTTVLGAETLERKAVNNVIDVLATLPVMKSSAGPQTGSASVAGNGGQSFVNLRGLGAVRTLVLVNGERIVPTTNLATVDVALLPTGALQRIDVVTGGASAAWGSDAVAGVVNFVIDTEFQGLKGDVQAGVTTRGDGKSGKVSLTMGDRFLGDRLHLMASGEYYQTDGVEPDSRPWSQYPSMDIFTNTASATNGLAPRLLRPFVYQTIVNGGTITGGPLAGISFGDNGTTYQTPFCALRTATSQVCDSDQENLFNNATQFAYMQSPQHRAALMLRGSYKLSDTWSVFAQGLYGESSSTVNSAALSTSVAGTLTIQRDNAFLPESIRQRMVALNLATFPLGTVALNRGGTVATRANTMYVGTVGVEGTVGGWNVRGYYEYGRARNHTTAANNYSRARLTEAVDAVRDANGAIVCRSRLTNPATACQPLNLFGPNSFSQPALAYIDGVADAVANNGEDVLALSVNGEPFSNWAGPVSIAAGVEYRHEKVKQVVDALSAVGGWGLLNPRPLNGNYTIREGFLETVVPILRGDSLGTLDLNAAARYTSYSSAGNVVTWKAGATWAPTPEFNLRFTRSRDIRAPNLLELYAASVGGSAGLTDPTRGNVQVTVQGRALGNPDLDFEKADTTAAGIVYSPEWAPGLRFSVDYYRIRVRDAIATLAFQQVVDRCNTTDPTLCQYLTRRADGQLIEVQSPYLNFAELKQDGVDIEASYRLDLDQVVADWGGSLELRALGAYMHEFEVNDGVVKIDRAGSISGGANATNFSGNPKWIWDFSATYTNGPFAVTWNGIYTGSGAYDTLYTAAELDGNHVPSHFSMNLSARYRFEALGSRSEVYLNVDNLTDKAPPRQVAYVGGNYDRVGRAFRLGFRFAY